MCKVIGVLYRRHCPNCDKRQEKVVFEDHIEVIPDDAEFSQNGMHNGHEVDFIVDRSSFCSAVCQAQYVPKTVSIR